MVILTIATMFLLMHRLGMFDEYMRYREERLLTEHVMQAYDDSEWERRMSDFRQSHPGLYGRYSMSLGRR